MATITPFLEITIPAEGDTSWTADMLDAFTKLDGVAATISGTHLTVSGVDLEGVVEILGAGGVSLSTDGSNTLVISGSSTGGVTDHAVLTNLDYASAGHTGFASAAALQSTSGTLSAEIDSDISTHAAIANAHHARYTKSENDAIIAGTNVTVVSGANTITISSVGGGSTANALVGSDGITVTSGDPTDTISGFYAEFVAASGTLETSIDTDIATHAAVSDAHHARYTDAEAVSALEPTTSALAASGVATDANVAANSAEILTVSGHLQTEIDAVEAGDVDDVNSVVGSVSIVGVGEVVVSTAGQTITVSGTDHTEGAAISGQWRFNTATIGNPGTGKFGMDAATYALATELHFDIQTDNRGDATNFLSMLSQGDRIYFQEEKDASKFAIFDVTGAVTDETGWFTVPATATVEGDLVSSNAVTGATFLYGGTPTQYTLVDGTRPFTGTVGGITPVANADLTTKLFVTTVSGNLQGQITSNVGDTATNAADIATNSTNIDANTVSGTATDASLSSHTGDATIHFTEGSIDHGSISGLADDDHTQYSLVDGTRAFTGTVGGITPVVDADLTTKLFVTTVSGNLQSQIDAVEASDVDAITVSGGSDITGSIDFVGSNGVNVSAAGNTVTFDGSGIEAGGGGAGTITDINAQSGPSITITGVGGVETTTIGNVITVSGTSGDIGSFTHTQSSASTEWIVTHNLGDDHFNWDIFKTDSDGGDSIQPDRVVPSGINSARIHFDPAASGVAFLSIGKGTQGVQGPEGPEGPQREVEVLSGMIESLNDKTFYLERKAFYSYDIVDMNWSSTLATGKFSLEIDDVEVPGINNITINTSDNTETATSLFTVASGSKFTMVTSGTSPGVVDFSFSIKTERLT